MQSVGVVFTEPGHTALERFEAREPGPGEVMVEAAFSALSPGTERSLMTGTSKRPFPLRIGYAMAGRVAKSGPGVNHLKVGDAVVATAQHASLQTLDARVCTPVPEGVDLEQAAFFNLAHTAIYGVRRAAISFGEPVAVLGQGLVGLLAAKMAQLSGALPVLSVDLDDRRLDLARQMGLPLPVNGADVAALEAILAGMDGGGPAAVIEATGTRQAVEQALHMVRERGRIVMLSTYHGDETIDFHRALTLKGAQLIGAYVNSKPFSLARTDLEMPSWPPSMAAGQRRYVGADIWTSDEDIRVFLNLLRYGALDLSPLITHRFSVDDAPRAYQLVLDQDRSLVGGVIRW